MITFFANGKPKGQPRTRATRRGKFSGVYTPPDADDWKTIVRVAARPVMPATPLTDPLKLRLEFFMPRPGAHYRKDNTLKPTAPSIFASKPDSDNLAKAVMDALSDIGFWRDDAIVSTLEVTKRYAADVNQMGCRVVCQVEADPSEWV